MKLKDLLKESASIEEQWEQFCSTYEVKPSNFKNIELMDGQLYAVGFDDKDITVPHGGMRLTILGESHKHLNCEFSAAFWSQLTIAVALDNFSVELKNDKLPLARKLNFYDCAFNSLRGIENLTTVEEIVFGEGCKSHEASIGLLPLLKAPKLKKVLFGDDVFGISENETRKLSLIVGAALKNKIDPLEFSEQLHDAGFEEYAKL